MPPRLLVSVRNAAEAAEARAGGADLLDVKEPARGPLGRADDATTTAVVRAAAGAVPVSAALGELPAVPDPPTVAGLAFAKWGLAGWGGRPDWPDRWRDSRAALAAACPGCRAVAVAYADGERVGAPPPEAVARFAAAEAAGAFLVDTAVKDGTTLLDWLTLPVLDTLIRTCRTAGVPVALAGSLGPREIGRLRGLNPDWFAVRGAACAGGRDGTVEADRVRSLAVLLRG
jgi:uncharacterized protein (UPF0264 family)